VQLQENGYSQDPDTGEMVEGWATTASPWAAIEPLSGREYLAAGAEQSEVKNRVTIRYRDDVTADMRIKYRDRYYNILAVLPDNDSGIEHLTLMCSEGVRLDQ